MIWFLSGFSVQHKMDNCIVQTPTNFTNPFYYFVCVIILCAIFVKNKSKISNWRGFYGKKNKDLKHLHSLSKSFFHIWYMGEAYICQFGWMVVWWVRLGILKCFIIISYIVYKASYLGSSKLEFPYVIFFNDSLI